MLNIVLVLHKYGESSVVGILSFLSIFYIYANCCVTQNTFKQCFNRRNLFSYVAATSSKQKDGFFYKKVHLKRLPILTSTTFTISTYHFVLVSINKLITKEFKNINLKALNFLSSLLEPFCMHKHFFVF